MIVLPDRHLLAGALAEMGIRIDPDAVPRAHYRAVRTLDRVAPKIDLSTRNHSAPLAPAAPLAPGAPATPNDYAAALFPQLGILPGQAAQALTVWRRLADRNRSRRVLWSEATPGAIETIDALRRAGIRVVIVTNSDGHGEDNLRASGFDGAPVIDSTVVGAAKPDPRIFEIALARAGATAIETVHVGDTLVNDVAGAHAAGITPIHFDPSRACRAHDHRHIRALPGIWRHVSAAGGGRWRVSGPSGGG